jgi:hypothetical protein
MDDAMSYPAAPINRDLRQAAGYKLVIPESPKGLFKSRFPLPGE